MRIGVVGAGAIGGTLAALLDRAGHEVRVAARGATPEAIRGSGLRLTGAFGEHVAHPAVSETLPTADPSDPAFDRASDLGSYDLVIFATKAMDAADAMTANAGAAVGAPVLVVQNGLDAIGGGADRLHASRLLGGLSVWAATQAEPGGILVTAPGSLVVGPTDDDDPVVRLLREAVPTSATRDLVGAQWSKLVINQVNALPAITGLSVQQTVADPSLRRVLTESIRETVTVGHAAGVRFGRFQGLSDPLLSVIRLVPARLAEQLPRLMARRMGDVPNYGSTLQSIRRGLPTEIDYLNGAVVAAAKRAGADAPLNARLTALVHDVELTGVFLDPAEVAERVLG